MISVLTIIILSIFLWISCIYFLLAKRLSPYKLSIDENKEQEGKRFLMIVPVHDEESIIQEKLENLNQLCLEKTIVCFVDSSFDNTGKQIQDYIKKQIDNKFKYIYDRRSRRNIKINIARKEFDCEYSIVSDADAVIKENFEEVLLEYFADKNVGVVSTEIDQKNALPIDKRFWTQQNKLRSYEARLGHCSVASGAFYAFRNSIIDEVANNVWADDIYIPFKANNKDFKSLIAKEIKVEEKRAPLTLSVLYKTKIRKAKDNILESVKNIFQINILKTPIWAMVFFTRLLQLFSPVLLLILLALFSIQIAGVVSMLLFAIILLINKSQIFLEKIVAKNEIVFTICVLIQTVILILSGKKIDYEVC